MKGEGEKTRLQRMEEIHQRELEKRDQMEERKRKSEERKCVCGRTKRPSSIKCCYCNKKEHQQNASEERTADLRAYKHQRYLQEHADRIARRENDEEEERELDQILKKKKP
jgi:hypothetical protein